MIKMLQFLGEKDMRKKMVNFNNDMDVIKNTGNEKYNVKNKKLWMGLITN